MISIRNTAPIAALALMLAACGGGASDINTNGGSGRPTPPPTLTVQQNGLNTPVIVGFPPTFNIDVLVNGGAPDGGPLYLVISDPAEVIKSAPIIAHAATTNTL